MRNFLKQLFCTHPALKSEKVSNGIGEEYRLTYQSPWQLFAVKETLYKCNKCGKQYYYPAGNQMEKEMNERFLEILTNISSQA